MRYILIIAALFCSLPQIFAQNNIAYGAGISYTNGAPSFTPPARTSRVAIDTITGKWYHYNTPGGWQLLGNTIEEIAGCSVPAYTPSKGDSKVVINNCTEPELYYWTGSVWVWINQGTTYTAGTGIRIESNSIILDSLYTLRFRTGSTTDGEAGRLTWDANEGTIDVVLNAGNVTGQMFEHVFFNCRNQTGSTITRGTVVMAVGTLGASGRILIAPAIANGTVNSEYILGTAAMNIANGSDGLVYHFGKDRGLNTTGASCGETWADGDVLYCSATTPGCLTKVLPTAPNLKVPIAFVIRAGNNGTLSIRPSHFPSLKQINDVQLTSPVTGQTLIYNSATGIWSNQTPADPSPTNEIQQIDTFRVNSTNLELSLTSDGQSVRTVPLSSIVTGGGGITGNGVAGYLPQYNTSTTLDTTGLFWNATTGRLGIGTTNPTTALDVFGDLNIKSANTNNANFTITTSTIGATATVTGGSLNTRIFYFSPGGGDTRFVTPGMNTEMSLWDASATQRIALSSSFGSFISNNLTIGTTGQTGRLHVRGAGSTSTTWTAQFHNSAGNNNALMIRDDGNVGIGTSAMTQNFNVGGTSYFNSTVFLNGNVNDSRGNGFIVQSGNTVASNRDLILGNALYARIRFHSQGVYLGGSFPTTNYLLYIDGGTASSPIVRNGIYLRPTQPQTGGNTAGGDIIMMLPDGTGTARKGAVLVGTETAAGSSAIIEFSSTDRGVLFPRMTTTQRNAITTPADGLVIYNTTDNKLQVRAAGSWVDLH